MGRAPLRLDSAWTARLVSAAAGGISPPADLLSVSDLDSLGFVTHSLFKCKSSSYAKFHVVVVSGPSDHLL